MQHYDFFGELAGGWFARNKGRHGLAGGEGVLCMWISGGGVSRGRTHAILRMLRAAVREKEIPDDDVAVGTDKIITYS